ncbi:conserved protein of unknown function [Ruminococcaceae bacterium BL-6]|nr:conserved protein of unknown function [Ruminococcaceae bacterium BL-6]
METETKKKRAGRPKTTKPVARATNSSSENTVQTKIETGPVQKKIPLDLIVSCKSAVHGTLTYVSKRINGYTVVWNDFKDEEFVEFQELLSMRNTDLRFFRDNWIVIDDSGGFTAQEILDALKVSKYYKAGINVDNFDSLFNESPEKIEETISKMSSGLKDTIAIRAKQLYNAGTLDSRKRIEALEKSLGIELEIRG